MNDLLAARSQMAMSLGFHIIFAAVGIAMPLLMVISEFLWLKTGKELYRTLTKKWAKGTAIMFAVGAVSGTVLSFELGLLWPDFMAYAGPIIGMPFSLEGFAFFLEAIFLGIFLYGWNRISPWAHWWSGVMVAISGLLSGMFVVAANGWMNTPTGFEVVNGQITSIDPWKAMFNKAAPSQAVHMSIAAYQAVAFAVAGIHAFLLFKRKPGRELHLAAFRISLGVAVVTAFLQPLSGHWSAEMVAETQPVKLAAMEGQFKTEAGAPLRIGGWPDETNKRTIGALEIPGGLSWLVHQDTSAVVRGLEDFPRADWPPVAVVHVAFQIMVGCGMTMMTCAIAAVVLRKRLRHDQLPRWFLILCMIAAPLGFIAIEAGWVVTEVGRQPWIIQGVMRTADAVTDMPHLVVPFLVFTGVYIFLGITVLTLLKRQVFSPPTPSKEELHVSP